MSTAALTTTTLSAALNARAVRFAVASTTGINGPGITTTGSVLVVGSEAMLVQRVPISGIVEVVRGHGGTKAKSHASSARVYHGARNLFAFEEAGGTGLGKVGLAGDPGDYPNYRLPLGAEATDDDGNVLVMCDFTETVYSGVTVGISNDGLFTAAVLTDTHQGAVGVVVEQTSSSDRWGWVQVYGYNSGAQLSSGDSAATSAHLALAASSVSTPASGLSNVVNTTSTAQAQIFGMFIVGAASTAVTSAASHTGVSVPVFLNYPYTRGKNSDTGMS